MDSIELPLFSSSATIDEALSQLRARKRSGLVVRGPSGYVLFYAGDLLYARDRGIVALEDISGGERVIRLEQKHIAQFRLNTVNPTSTWQEYETFLQSVNSLCTLIGETGDTARVVTAHETDAAALALTGGYDCDGTPTHHFPKPSVYNGQDCPKWPACSRPDGSKPKVHPAP